MFVDRLISLIWSDSCNNHLLTFCIRALVNHVTLICLNTCKHLHPTRVGAVPSTLPYKASSHALITLASTGAICALCARQIVVDNPNITWCVQDLRKSLPRCLCIASTCIQGIWLQMHESSRHHKDAKELPCHNALSKPYGHKTGLAQGLIPWQSHVLTMLKPHVQKLARKPFPLTYVDTTRGTILRRGYAAHPIKTLTMVL